MDPAQAAMVFLGLVNLVVTVALLIFSSGRRSGSSQQTAQDVGARVAACEAAGASLTEQVDELAAWRREMDVARRNTDTALETANREMSKLASTVQALSHGLKDWAAGEFIRRDLCNEKHKDFTRRLEATEDGLTRIRNGTQMRGERR